MFRPIRVDHTNCLQVDIKTVVSVNLGVNGRSESIKFYSADIHPYDVILG
jgi:hypothetical protein